MLHAGGGGGDTHTQTITLAASSGQEWTIIEMRAILLTLCH